MAGHFSSLVATPANATERVPVSVLTGFLGSGKTTLLNRLLQLPGLAGCAVIVNEFGETGIDQDLIIHATEHTLLLANGCLCCAMRGDLLDALHRLRTALGTSLQRVLIETSGLADPGPILRTLTGDAAITAHYRLATVACTIDAVHGARTLRDFPEAQTQGAVADHIFVTKLDQTGNTLCADLAHVLDDSHTHATVHLQSADYARILDQATRTSGNLQTATIAKSLHYRLSVDAPTYSVTQATSAQHTERITACVVRHSDLLPRSALDDWLDMLATTRGNDLLRVKGIVGIAEHPDQPLVIHGVQHLFSPPEIQQAWPGPDHDTRIVIIARNLTADTLQHTLNVLIFRHTRGRLRVP